MYWVATDRLSNFTFSDRSKNLLARLSIFWRRNGKNEIFPESDSPDTLIQGLLKFPDNLLQTIRIIFRRYVTNRLLYEVSQNCVLFFQWPNFASLLLLQ